MKIPLTLAHSPDPDDVFMWWPLTGMIEAGGARGRGGGGRVLSAPEIDTGRFEFRALAEDIAVLNRRAIERADLDITAMSMFTYAHVQDRYVLTDCGASVGEDYGPKIVVKGVVGDGSRVAGLSEGEHAQRVLSAILERGGKIAVPGVKTTAFACLCMLMEWSREDDWRERIVELPFDVILETVARGRSEHGDHGRGADIAAGLLIHQSQLTYPDLGLVELIDFGRFWKARTGLPLTLGGNALRRDLDGRFGAGTLHEVANLLEQSIDYALAHRDRATRYAMAFAPEISRAQADRYIDMYVSGYTRSLGEIGQRAVRRLLDEAAARGLAPGLTDRAHFISGFESKA